MKIIYKMGIELRDNTTFNYLFDSYDAVEEFLENNFDKDKKALDIRIGALVLCDRCQEYKLANCCKLIKHYGRITVVCEGCFDHYKIDLMRYIKGAK